MRSVAILVASILASNVAHAQPLSNEVRKFVAYDQPLIALTQHTVNGWVRLKLYKGNVIVVSRDSKTDSLFDMNIATFDEDGGAYNQADAGGFIKLNALRMRIAAKARAKRAG